MLQPTTPSGDALGLETLFTAFIGQDSGPVDFTVPPHDIARLGIWTLYPRADWYTLPWDQREAGCKGFPSPADVFLVAAAAFDTGQPVHPL